MTKAEIKKIETEKKYDFINRVYGTVLGMIPAETRACQKKIQVSIAHQGINRYIRFHVYGQDLSFKIYADGNISVEMKEALHNDYVEQLFGYDSDAEKQDAFIENLSKMASDWVRVFIGNDTCDFHTYMDYVSHEPTAYEAYKQMQEDCHYKYNK